jgi:hypothetical protein
MRSAPASKKKVPVPAKPPRTKDWRSTLGMFSGDALMKEIDEEGRRIRKAEAKEQSDDAA